MTRKIAPVEINGKLVLVEVEDIELLMPKESQETDGPGGNYENVSTDDPSYFEKLKGKVADMTDLVGSVVSSVDKGMDAVKPDEWSIEFTVGYKVEKELKIPFISGKGEASGGVKITATWKKDTAT